MECHNQCVTPALSTTEDVVHEAWLDAKSFVSSCEEQIRYRLDDTFLPGIYASAPTPLPPANYEAHTPSGEDQELAVLHHTVAASKGDGTTACATVAHCNTPRNQIPAPKTTPGHHSPATASKAAILPTLGPERKGNTPVHDPEHGELAMQ